MPIYSIRTYTYYEFEAPDDETALEMFLNDSDQIDYHHPVDESYAQQLLCFDTPNGDPVTLWDVNNHLD